ncbi:hypothetical protein FG93_00815 [Bosea sp. LC85]|nr:hypothetical protein FG93_00815 [Bosea sp. LC85]
MKLKRRLSRSSWYVDPVPWTVHGTGSNPELTDGDEEYDGSRSKALKGILGAYRQAAERALGEENPEVREAILKDKIRAHRAMVPGGDEE